MSKIIFSALISFISDDSKYTSAIIAVYYTLLMIAIIIFYPSFTETKNDINISDETLNDNRSKKMCINKPF